MWFPHVREIAAVYRCHIVRRSHLEVDDGAIGPTNVCGVIMVMVIANYRRTSKYSPNIRNYDKHILYALVFCTRGVYFPDKYHLFAAVLANPFNPFHPAVVVR